jgi:hypothetical protein
MQRMVETELKRRYSYPVIFSLSVVQGPPRTGPPSNYVGDLPRP